MDKPFAVGAAVTSRDGTSVNLGRSLRAPYWVCVDGVVVADYGDDEAAAEAHYLPLLKAHRLRMGWTPVPAAGEIGSELEAAHRCWTQRSRY
ncbi:hypothetical protein D3C86_1639580 [compost metagenome]